MARQDDYIRITLRIPGELHAKLVGLAGEASLDAEIIHRLERSVMEREAMSDMMVGREAAQFALRLSEELRDEIKEAAARNGRSMNAEILVRMNGGAAAQDTRRIEAKLDAIMAHLGIKLGDLQ